MNDFHLTEDDDLKCNNNLLKIFGIFGSKMKVPLINAFNSNKRCKSFFTCCDDTHFKSIIPQMVETFKRFRRKYQNILDLLTMIGSKQVLTYLKKNIVNEKCIDIIKAVNFTGKNKEENLKDLTDETVFNNMVV